MPLGLGLGLDKVSFILRGLRAKFRGDATMTAMLDGILRDLQADFVSEATVTAALETIKLLDADFSGEGTVTGDLDDYAYLLDDYSGAAAAYSIRLLSSTYSGGLVEIRRSSDNATKAFLPDSNNELSLSSEAVVGSQTLGNFVGANNGFVVTWCDQSGNSNDASNSTASEQPQIISSGSLITENGKPAISAQASNKVLQSATGVIGTTTEATVCSVIKSFDTGVSQSWYGVSSGAYGSSDDNLIYRQRAGNYQSKINDNSLNSEEDNGSVDTNQKLISQIYNGGSFNNNRVNQVDSIDSTSIPSSLNLSQDLELFGILGTILSGDIAMQEFIFWKADQTSNINGIETNQNDFFSIY